MYVIYPQLWVNPQNKQYNKLRLSSKGLLDKMVVERKHVDSCCEVIDKPAI